MIGPGLPDLPGTLPTDVHVVEQLLLPKGVHARPEAIVFVGEEPPLCGQPPERLLYELVAVVQVLEDPISEGKEAAVYPYSAIADVLDAPHAAAVVDLHHAEAARRRDAREGRHRVRLALE